MNIEYNFFPFLYDRNGKLKPFFKIENQNFDDNLVFHPSILSLDPRDVKNIYAEYYKKKINVSNIGEIISRFVNLSKKSFDNYMSLKGDYLLFYDTGYWKINDFNSNVYIGVGTDNLNICLEKNNPKDMFFILNNRDLLMNFHYHYSKKELNVDMFMFNSILPFYDLKKVTSNPLEKIGFEQNYSEKFDVDLIDPTHDYLLTGEKFKLKFDYGYYWNSKPRLKSLYMPFFKNEELLISPSKNTPEFLMAQCHHGFTLSDFENDIDFKFSCSFYDFPSLKIMHGCTLYPLP